MQSRMATLVERLGDAARRRADAGAGAAFSARTDAALAPLRVDHRARRDGGADPLARVAEVFGLDDVDADLLFAAAAADLDLNVAELYGALTGADGPAPVSVGLLLELAGLRADSADAFRRLGPDGLLRRTRLVDVAGAGVRTLRTVLVPEPVVAALAGADPADPVVTPLRRRLVPLALPGTDEVSRALEKGTAVVWVRALVGSAGGSFAAGAVAGAGIDWLAVDLARARAGDDVADVLARAVREAGLRAAMLVVLGADALAAAAEQGAFRPLADAAVPVILVGTRAWHSGWLPEMPLTVAAEPLSSAHRAAVWHNELAGLTDGSPVPEELLGLRLPPEDVVETVRSARAIATARDRTLDTALVREAARAVGGSRGTAADRVEATGIAGRKPGFDDLVLPDNVLETLQRLVSWGRHRADVAAHPPLRRHSRGIAALFAGNPGTGKSLTARVIAEELSLDLFQVELSAVVDKYIGETEKNLERVFQTAEALDVVLFFDEADALFGSRSEVHDARDRYANQEIAYLLQRMENFEGITILATNLRGNLDRAFSRRMSFIVHFPDPDPGTRKRLWQHHLALLPALDPGDPVDVDFLAEAADLTGGDIRNIVIAAAYEAIAAGESVGHRHVVDAAVREFHKLGRVVPVDLHRRGA